MAEIHSIETAEFFQFISEHELAIIDVYGDWCMPCQRLLKILPNMMEQLEGKAVMAKLNIDTIGALKNTYEIKVVPTFLFFRNGELVKRYDGVTTLAELKQTVETLTVEKVP